MLNKTKTVKLLILIFVIFTLLLNLINLAFVINYENAYNKYNRILISNAGDNVLKLKEACQNIKNPVEEYLIYKKIATWSFVAIMISLAIIIIEFALAKSKIILFSPEDWKHLRIITFTIFLASFIFAYTPLYMEDNFRLIHCLKIID